MSNIRKIAGFLLAIVCFIQVGFAQDIDWSVSVEKNEITIGDQVNVRFSALETKDAFVTFSLEGNSEDSKIEILNTSVDTTFGQNNSVAAVNQIFTISAYRPGEYAITPAIAYFYPNDTASYKEEGKALSLFVKTFEIDSTQDIRDIRTVQKESVHFSEILPFLLIFLGILLIGGLVAYILYRYKQRKPILPFFEKPVVPYYQIALENMETLRQKNLWQNDRIKEYYTELIDIFKFYLNGRYEIQAAEMTSDELIEALNQNIEVPKDTIPNIQYMLTNSDLVKFAKSTPLPDEHDRAFQIVLGFIQQTMPAPEVESQKEKVESSK